MGDWGEGVGWGGGEGGEGGGGGLPLPPVDQWKSFLITLQEMTGGWVRGHMQSRAHPPPGTLVGVYYTHFQNQ